MRPGQNRRMRGRNNSGGNNSNNNGNRKSPNPLQRSYESNGPDVKVRGTAQHVAEKYLQLARDAQSSGDPVAAENYFQHAEHYYRILLAGQEQMAQQFGHSFPPNRAFNDADDYGEDDGEDDAQAPQQSGPGQPGAPQPEIRVHQNGYGGHGAQRSEGEAGEGQPNGGQRHDRQPRMNERQNHERPNIDRQNHDRQNHDRNAPRRFDRNDRDGRRFDRAEGGQNGQAGHNGSAGHAPRVENSSANLPAEDGSGATAPVERRFERGPRPERRPRREFEAETSADAEPAGLPSFLTTPVRVPVAVVEEPSEAAADGVGGDAAGDGPVKRPRGRRRSPREVMDALGSDGDSPAEAE